MDLTARRRSEMSRQRSAARRGSRWTKYAGVLSARPFIYIITSLLVAAVALASDAPAPDDRPIPAGKDFGAGLTMDQVSDLGEVMEHPEQFADRPVVVTGRISDVCQHKGCWTVLSQGEHNIRVRFKDYGFFIPTDCSGKTAYVEGMVRTERLSKQDVEHYKGESRHDDPGVVEGFEQSVGFLASGVRLIGVE
jgi:hypothetical protein